MRRYILTTSVGLFILLWAYRICKIILIILHGSLYDFRLYYTGVRQLLFERDFISAGATSYGPPYTLIPFLPFGFLPEKVSAVLFTGINISLFFYVCVLVWKKYLVKFDYRFFILVSLCAFSFPLIFSLAMGNPAGIVTFGVYILLFKDKKLSSWLWFMVSVLLKIFPISVLPSIFARNKKLKNPILLMFLSAAVILILLPPQVWVGYSQKLKAISTPIQTISDPIAYNQSIASTLTRFGTKSTFLSPQYLIVCFTLFAYYFYKNGFSKFMSSLALSLLIHPFPWQHYFTVFIPFLILKIGLNDFRYLIPLVLISIDGGRFPLFSSSQFISALIIFFLTLNDLKTKEII